MKVLLIDNNIYEYDYRFIKKKVLGYLKSDRVIDVEETLSGEWFRCHELTSLGRNRFCFIHKSQFVSLTKYGELLFC